jgi:hypothetical protein
MLYILPPCIFSLDIWPFFSPCGKFLNPYDTVWTHPSGTSPTRRYPSPSHAIGDACAPTPSPAIADDTRRLSARNTAGPKSSSNTSTLYNVQHKRHDDNVRRRAMRRTPRPTRLPAARARRAPPSTLDPDRGDPSHDRHPAMVAYPLATIARQTTRERPRTSRGTAGAPVNAEAQTAKGTADGGGSPAFHAR